MAHQTVFAMCAYNAKSGVVVDLGERMDVVPVVDGYKVSSGNFFTLELKVYNDFWFLCESVM